MRAWDQFLKLQEKELGEETVRLWLRALHVKGYDAGNLYLEASDSFQILWFEEHMRTKVAAHLLNNNRRPIRVHLCLAGDEKEKKASKKRGAEKSLEIPSIHFDELDPLRTFDRFVLTENNLLAHKILCELAGQPLEGQTTSHSASQLAVFNPIYVYGPKGVGKTHMLMATAHAILHAGLKVVYVKAQTFTDHVVQAIRAGEMHHFRELYRKQDVLIVDDVHKLSRKSATQEELFHTFNALHLAGKQIILGAGFSPQELQSIEPRLVSRFEWGIALPLEAYNKKDLVRVAHAKAEALQVSLPSKVEEHLCCRFCSGSHAVCAAIQALILRLHMQNRTAARPLFAEQITVGQVDELLHDLVEEEEQRMLSAESIVSIVAVDYGILVEDILGKAQRRECAKPRQVAMYLCRHMLALPYLRIGEYFHRDHSTVMASVRLVKEKLERSDVELTSDVSRIMRKLQA